MVIGRLLVVLIASIQIMTVLQLSYPLAFLAGLVSFLSPCVLPLAPAYLAFLGGQATRLDQPATTTRQRIAIFSHGISFVLGFSAVFISFFYVLRALNVTVFAEHQRVVAFFAGAIVIILALQILGILRIPALIRERRLHLPLQNHLGTIPAFLLGVTFAAGWTPCIGPQLAAILTVASQGNFAGLPVMVIYCLGLGIPFLLLAALTERAQLAFQKLHRWLVIINFVAGSLLLLVGLLLLTDQITLLNRYAGQSPFDL